MGGKRKYIGGADRKKKENDEFTIDVESKGENAKWRDKTDGSQPCGELQTYRHAERFLLSNETMRNIKVNKNIYKYRTKINHIHRAHVIKLYSFTLYFKRGQGVITVCAM